MTTLVELTKQRLDYVIEKFGADGPMARQFQMQLIALENSGSTEATNQAMPVNDDQDVN